MTLKYKGLTICIALLVVFSMLLTACGGEASQPTEAEQPVEEAPAAEEAAPAETFRVAVIMPSAINDLAFSQSMYDALLEMQEKLGGPEAMELVYSENMFVVDDAAAAIRDYASQGYNLVIAHGSQYGSSLREIAPDFPETSFAHGTTVDTFVDEGINNVFAYEAAANQGGYVNGVIAGMLTESNVLGVIGPIETGDAKLYTDGFVAGVASVNPDAEVNINYIGSFSDVALGTEAANTHIAAGADILTGCSQMVVGPIGVAKEKGAYWFGTQSSQVSLAPDNIVTTQIYNWTVVLDDIFSLIQEGTYGGKTYSITLNNNGLVMEYNSAFDLPEDVKAAAEEAAQGIIDGSITVGEAPMGEEGEEAVEEVAALPEFEDTFRVAVIMPSAINDLAFSQSMIEALLKIQEDMGGADKMELVYSENMFVVDDAAAAIRDYASQGYNLVIAHGSQYGSSLREIAPDFPETSFAHGTTVDTFVDEGINNVFAYEAAADQGGFVNGVAAGMLTESNVLGVVGPIETGDAKLYIDGFVAGVASVNPDAEVNVNYIGSFSDVALDSEAANTHIAAGADVLTGSAQMVVGAIGVAKEKGVYWFGTQSSQTSLAPEIVVANQVYDWTVVLHDIIGLIADGTYGGTSYNLTLENKGLVMDYNPDFEMPDDVKETVDSTMQGIVDGSIQP